jgi:hypothetical protein
MEHLEKASSPINQSSIDNTQPQMATSTQYPSRDEIFSIFKPLEDGNSAETFKRVSPDVDWTVMGTHPCAGRYRSLKEFQEATFSRLGKIMKPPGLKLKVRNVIGGSDQEWAVIELIAVAECKSGMFERDLVNCGIPDDSRRTEVRQYLRLGCSFRSGRSDCGSESLFGLLDGQASGRGE